MDCSNTTSEIAQRIPWLICETLFIPLLSFCPIFVLIAIFKTGNLHFNFRLLLVNSCISLLLRIVSQTGSHVYFLVKYSNPSAMSVPCSSHYVPVHWFLLISSSTIPILCMERAVATFFYKFYEKRIVFRVIGFSAVFIQLLYLVCLMLPIVFPNLSLSDWSSDQIMFYFIISMTVVHVICILVFRFLYKTNKEIMIEQRNGPRVPSRYQLKENLRSTKAMKAGSFTVFVWLFIYILTEVANSSHGKKPDLFNSPVVSILSLCLLICLIVLPNKNIRANFFRALGVERIPYIRKLCASAPVQRYKIGSTQQLSSTSQNYHFDSLNRHWESEQPQNTAAP